MKLTALVLRRDRLSWLFFSLVLLLGLLVYQDFPSREEPAIRIPRAIVYTAFPGLPPEQVEDLITRKLEEKFREISGIKRIISYSQPGLSIVELHAYEHIPDFQPVWDKVRRKAEDAIPQLPEGVDGPHVNDDYADVSIVTFALTGRDWRMAELREEAHDVRDALYGVTGVRRVSLFGIPGERVYIEADPDLLEATGFSIGEAVRTIRDRNLILPAGKIIAGQREVVVETTGKLATAADLEAMEVPGRDGRNLLPLADYVDIRATYSEPPQEQVYFNGEPAVMIAASMQKGHNVKGMGPLLRDFVESRRFDLPVGMQLHIASMQPDVVEVAIANVTNSLYQTLFMVLAVVMLFLGLREGIIVGATVPLTLLAALVLMFFAGVELHYVSLASLIISLGMLVDNGIVITEDAHLRINKGVAPSEAVVASSSDLSLPLLTSTLTTVLAFMPILTVNTTSGEFSRSMAIVVGFTLLSSWFIAVSFVPLLAAKVLRPTRERREFVLAPLYARALAASLRRPLLTLALILLLAGVFQGLFRFIDTEMFPYSSQPQVLVYVDLPSGYNVYETEAAVEVLSNWLLDEERRYAVKRVTAYIGTGGPRFSLSIVPNKPAPHRAFMTVHAADGDSARKLVADIRDYAAREISQASVRTELISRGIVPPGVVELRVSGPDPDRLYNIATEIEAALAAIPDTLHVRNDWENRSRRLQVVIDQSRAARAGVSYRNIADSLNAEFSGNPVSVLRRGDNLVPVLIRSSQEDGMSADSRDLRTLKIPLGDGGAGYVTLDQVADIREVAQFGNLIRRNLVNTVTVSGKHLHWDAARLQEAWDTAIDQILADLPPGYRVELGGELENFRQSGGTMLISVPLFIGLILCVVIAQFNSVRRTVIVFATIPLAVSGGVLGLYITGVALDFIGLLGFISLAGIVVNHAIVLVDKMDKLSAAGMSAIEAAIAAGRHRLRPVCITSITTILGLAPLLLMEEPLFHAMAVVIMSGLAVGTLFTLFMVPLLYRMMLSPLKL